MRVVLLVVSLSLLAACSSRDFTLWSLGSSGALVSKDGQGGMINRPDGQQGFAFAISADSFSGQTVDPESARLNAIGMWLAKSKNCPRGYVVDKRSEISNAIYYEGRCKQDA